MIDRNLLRENPDRIREALTDRGSDFDLDRVIELDVKRRELLDVEQLRARRNELSQQIGKVIRDGGNAESLNPTHSANSFCLLHRPIGPRRERVERGATGVEISHLPHGMGLGGRGCPSPGGPAPRRRRRGGLARPLPVSRPPEGSARRSHNPFLGNVLRDQAPAPEHEIHVTGEE